MFIQREKKGNCEIHVKMYAPGNHDINQTQKTNIIFWTYICIYVFMYTNVHIVCGPCVPSFKIKKGRLMVHFYVVFMNTKLKTNLPYFSYKVLLGGIVLNSIMRKL